MNGAVHQAGGDHIYLTIPIPRKHCNKEKQAERMAVSSQSEASRRSAGPFQRRRSSKGNETVKARDDDDTLTRWSKNRRVCLTGARFQYGIERLVKPIEGGNDGKEVQLRSSHVHHEGHHACLFEWGGGQSHEGLSALLGRRLLGLAVGQKRLRLHGSAQRHKYDFILAFVSASYVIMQCKGEFDRRARREKQWR